MSNKGKRVKRQQDKACRFKIVFEKINETEYAPRSQAKAKETIYHNHSSIYSNASVAF